MKSSKSLLIAILVLILLLFPSIISFYYLFKSQLTKKLILSFPDINFYIDNINNFIFLLFNKPTDAFSILIEKLGDSKLFKGLFYTWSISILMFLFLINKIKLKKIFYYNSQGIIIFAAVTFSWVIFTKLYQQNSGLLLFVILGLVLEFPVFLIFIKFAEKEKINLFNKSISLTFKVAISKIIYIIIIATFLPLITFIWVSPMTLFTDLVTNIDPEIVKSIPKIISNSFIFYTKYPVLILTAILYLLCASLLPITCYSYAYDWYKKV